MVGEEGVEGGSGVEADVRSEKKERKRKKKKGGNETINTDMIGKSKDKWEDNLLIPPLPGPQSPYLSIM